MHFLDQAAFSSIVNPLRQLQTMRRKTWHLEHRQLLNNEMDGEIIAALLQRSIAKDLDRGTASKQTGEGRRSRRKRGVVKKAVEA